MKKAYIVVAHKNPGQLHRLISRLNDNESEFFIHIDKKADLPQFVKVKDLGGMVHLTERFDATWGGYGIIRPYLSALKEIQKSPVKFQRIILLSGQDYPIKTNKAINDFFEKSPYSNFIDYGPIPNFKKWPGSDRGGLYRVDKYYFGTEWYEKFCSRSLNFFSAYLPFLRRKIPDGMLPYTGQTWWILDMEAVNYILDFHHQRPEYIEFHRNTFVADELFVQMIIANSKNQQLLQSIENSEKRFTIWHDVRDAHPKLLDKRDIDAIIKSNELFARKFDDNHDAEILDLIDSRILFV